MSLLKLRIRPGTTKVPRPDFHMLVNLKVEIPFRVVVRYILDHLVDEAQFALRKLAVLYIFAEEVAEDSAEILMARI